MIAVISSLVTSQGRLRIVAAHLIPVADKRTAVLSGQCAVVEYLPYSVQIAGHAICVVLSTHLSQAELGLTATD